MKNNTQNLQIISAKELANYLGVSYSTARMIKKDILSHYKKKYLTLKLVKKYFDD
ncbi:hypothetical protein [Ornithobacterium rhinotracheale]|uniref:Uncharacterized protein n=1 Tax=Ornithobacterium rhinotracheale (strain ATCC 51463 / DSM 15997 / CCUG 23171 / CIP 104009 / LMG 9086) TaxID=867902 RepID=I3ZZU6_ORNRL|nr:hypothetical protein Ornrh_0386 [Ornithobacterium rhinotracheale DSM 15997]AIP98520.1 hypothetical protein Q785_00300 [Ornithobacterium rhinotracheale ORT-UMN 88]KGB66639.1 hypothetical protein Q787_06245 [Ornithobacterium rhinotracheale H06-030791]AFL96856.1 hypothetical protein Ornrh_0658 [Ornithobacterium rhinotracheale DSM 15997]AFL96904.1 hypothetical protein Ornrh_0706 [Ornithobacterium rhinotracheale DSM 15997]